MGIIFLVIWLVIFTVIAAILGMIGVAVVYPFLSKKNKKKENAFDFPYTYSRNSKLRR